MNAAGQTLCLNMIVKNEAAVIRRCLDSVRPIIDHWVIVDTGSTDGTQNIIREHLRELPGELHERLWRDFAYNRSEALELARGKSDYTLIVDADDTLEILPETALPVLTADSYTVEIRDNATVYQGTQLVRSALPWRYEGVLHEYITCDGAGPSGNLSGIRMRRNCDGARLKDLQTYRRDAAALEAALQTEAKPFLISRYRFYLAQSYRDCGEREKALENYLLCAELGFSQQEVFISLYGAAQMKEQLGHPDQEVIDTYLRAADALPTRAEAVHGASRFCRYKGRNEEGYQIAKRGLDIPMPSGALFVEPWIYETGLLDEFAVNAYWSGHNRDCLDACLRILATGKLPERDMQRVVANARAANERLPGDPKLGSRGAEGFIEQHPLVPPRPLRSRVSGSPRVLVAILAKQKEPSLPLYLECIESLDYPKSSIVLYIRTNNNTDGTERILREWIKRVGQLYADVDFDAEDVAAPVEQFGVHEWNATRFDVLCHIRNISLQKTLEHGCQFYFVCDVDNFVRPCTLRELVALNLPIVAPFLRSIIAGQFHSNYHAEIDANGFYEGCDQYYWVLNRHVRGIIEMPVVHCTYLVRSDVLRHLTYDFDMTGRWDYVIFSDSARKSLVNQYLDNRQVYGYLTAAVGGHTYIENGIDLARKLINDDLDLNRDRLKIAREIRETLCLLAPYAVLGHNKVRIGHDRDGGYVMLNDLNHEIVCYSLGVGREVSWDLELAKRGAVVFQYDDSVDGPPVSHANFHFRRVRVAVDDSSEANTISLDTLLESGHHSQNKYVILNMDLEGSEWDIIDTAKSETLNVFSQIIIEFHGLAKLKEASFNLCARKIFQKLGATHFPIHLHGNNWGTSFEVGDFECPDVLEVTFVNRATYCSSRDFATYPTTLDKPNRSDRPDFDLGRFPFNVTLPG
ncbi:MAG: glycosyltransferase [Alphaproteobacteria bacterium]